MENIHASMKQPEIAMMISIYLSKHLISCTVYHTNLYNDIFRLCVQVQLQVVYITQFHFDDISTQCENLIKTLINSIKHKGKSENREEPFRREQDEGK